MKKNVTVIRPEQRIKFAVELGMHVLNEGMSREEVIEEMDLSEKQYQRLVGLYPEELKKKIYDTAIKNRKKKN